MLFTVFLFLRDTMFVLLTVFLFLRGRGGGGGEEEEEEEEGSSPQRLGCENVVRPKIKFSKGSLGQFQGLYRKMPYKELPKEF